jgi:CRISPR-associated protein (TIGR03984 family)
MTVGFKEPTKPRIEPLPDIPPDFAEDNGRWLVERASGLLGPTGISYALIHADDGVLWGIVDGSRLIMPPSGDWTPKLRSRTIQQCRIFATKGELLVWREAEHRYRGRLVSEEAGAVYEQIPEAYVLYGSRVHTSQAVSGSFTRVFEPTSGIRQIVPKHVTDSDFANGYRLTLTVSHYLSTDEDGQAGIYCSRLSDLNLTKL